MSRHNRWVSKIWNSNKGPNQRKNDKEISQELAAEGLWATTLNHESFKAACILRSICMGETYKEALRKQSVGNTHLQKEGTKLDPHIINQAKGLIICSVLRAGLWETGAGGSGVVVIRQGDGSWSYPAAVRISTPEIGSMVGVDIYDMLLVLNTHESVDAVTRGRFIVGGSLYTVAGPLNVGWFLEADEKSLKAPIWSYLRYNRYYADAPLEHTAIFSRDQENEEFYSPQRLTIRDILTGSVRSPPDGLKGFMEMLRCADGESDADISLVPKKAPPSDFRVVEYGHTFGVPDPEDPDPYGLRALQNQGISAREAKTGKIVSPESFEFTPRLESPVHDSYYGRARSDAGSVTSGRTSWRKSTNLSNLDGGLASPGLPPTSAAIGGIDASSRRTSTQSQRAGGSDALVSPITARTSPMSPFQSSFPSKGMVDSESGQTAVPAEYSKGVVLLKSPRNSRLNLSESVEGSDAESLRHRHRSSAPSTSNATPSIAEETGAPSQDYFSRPSANFETGSNEPDEQSVQSVVRSNENEVDTDRPLSPSVTVNGHQPEQTSSNHKEAHLTGVTENDPTSERGEHDQNNTAQSPQSASEDIHSAPISDLDTDDEFEDLDDVDEEAEVIDASSHVRTGTMLINGGHATTVSRAKVVEVPKATPPALPSRNPFRVVNTGSDIDESEPAGSEGNLHISQEGGAGKVLARRRASNRSEISENGTGASTPGQYDDASDQFRLPEVKTEGPKLSSMLESLRNHDDEISP